jgi:hypothetical protein
MSGTKKEERSGRRVRGRPFVKGNLGRPRGARNKRTVALEALLDGQAEAIIGQAVTMALAGDRAALRLCFERVLGARRDRSLELNLPPIKTAEDGAAALAHLVGAVAQGQISPAEAAALGQLIEATISAIGTSDFERRLEALEKGGVPAGDDDRQ